MNPETPTVVLQPLRPDDLVPAAPAQLSWLWHGYLAPGRVTSLISSPKVGKTTLLSHVLARMAQGGQLAGRAVAPGRALVISEESGADWNVRCRQRGLGPHVQFVCRPFGRARPTEAQWVAFAAGLEALHRQEALDLVVLDALAALLPGYAETCAPKLLDCLLPLQALAQQGPAVWLLHHATKGKHADGQAARGSGALGGFADIIMELSYYHRARSSNRCRRVCAYSRYEETPRHLVLELDGDGTAYLLRTDTQGKLLVRSWPEVYYILGRATQKFTQQAILDRWPVEDSRPDRSTLARWLQRATQQGLVCCSGTGFRSNPLVYWLPEREPLLWPGDDASEEAKHAWRERIAPYLGGFPGGAAPGGGR